MLGIGDGHHVLPCTRQGQEEFQNVGHESRLNENISEYARMLDLHFWDPNPGALSFEKTSIQSREAACLISLLLIVCDQLEVLPCLWLSTATSTFFPGKTKKQPFHFARVGDKMQQAISTCSYSIAHVLQPHLQLLLGIVNFKGSGTDLRTTGIHQDLHLALELGSQLIGLEIQKLNEFKYRSETGKWVVRLCFFGSVSKR